MSSPLTGRSEGAVSQTPLVAQPLTSAALASALVCAARVFRVDPSSVFAKEGRKARILAAAALRACTGKAATVLAPMLKISATEIAPSMLIKVGITTDHLLDVVEAMGSPVSQPSAAPEAARKPEVETAATGEASAGASATADAPDRAGSARPAHMTDARRQRRASTPRVVAHPKPRPGEVPERALPAPRFPSENRVPANEPVQARPGALARIKAVSDDIVRWAAQFLVADWDLADVAELFDVDADTLADRLEAVAA